MKRAGILVSGLTILAILGIGAPGGKSGGMTPEGIPAGSMGLVQQDVEAVPVPDSVRDNSSDPGERPLSRPWNDAAPPVIPHGIADFTPITRSDNACVECHAVEEKIAGEPTPIPRSHYLDLRNAPDTVRGEIAGARHVCTSCHVARTDARPLPVGAP